MGFAGYVTACVQLYCVSFHCLSLHVSAYTAIFRCVGYFYFRMPEGICFAGFLPSFHVVTLCTFPFVFACGQTHTQETTKLMKENSTGTKHKWKRAECDHVQKNQRSRSLQEYENKNILHT
jgi:hypothetical protein